MTTPLGNVTPAAPMPAVDLAQADPAAVTTPAAEPAVPSESPKTGMTPYLYRPEKPAEQRLVACEDGLVLEGWQEEDIQVNTKIGFVSCDDQFFLITKTREDRVSFNTATTPTKDTSSITVEQLADVLYGGVSSRPIRLAEEGALLLNSADGITHARFYSDETRMLEAVTHDETERQETEHLLKPVEAEGKRYERTGIDARVEIGGKFSRLQHQMPTRFVMPGIPAEDTGGGDIGALDGFYLKADVSPLGFIKELPTVWQRILSAVRVGIHVEHSSARDGSISTDYCNSYQGCDLSYGMFEVTMGLEVGYQYFNMIFGDPSVSRDEMDGKAWGWDVRLFIGGGAGAHWSDKTVADDGHSIPRQISDVNFDGTFRGGFTFVGKSPNVWIPDLEFRLFLVTDNPLKPINRW